MKNNDTHLIQRTLDGDDSAFAELVEKYQKQVHALVWRKIGDFHIAEEITQDTFLKAYQKLGCLKKPQRFASWLYVIATNRCNTWLRKRHLRKQLLEDKDIDQTDETTYSEYVVEENERITVVTQRDVVQKLLAKLGESERTIMTLHYFGEMSCTEIGAFMGVSANTVKSRLRRAQHRLQKEETMIREALDNYQVSPKLTENIMQEISRTKPNAPSGSKPIVPWAIAASTLAVVLLMIGFGDHLYFGIFQKPYSLDATAEMTVEIVDAPIVANIEHKPNLRTQIAGANLLDKTNESEQQPNESTNLSAEAQIEQTVEDSKPVEDLTQWELPKAAKARLGKGGIRAIQFSPDGSQLAVGSNIGVWLYDIKTGQELSLFPGNSQSIAFSPDGHYLVSSGRNSDNNLDIWEVSTGRRLILTEPQPAAAVLRFDDNKTLVSLNKSRNQISRLDINTGKSSITPVSIPPGFFLPEPYALSHDKIAIGNQDGRIDIWETTSGESYATYGESGFSQHVFTLAFSPDGMRLASGGEDTLVRLWNVASDDEPVILRKHAEWVNVLAFSPDGKKLASGSTDKTVQLWDTSTGELLMTFTGHINGISALTFAPNGSTLASASADGTVRFWNTDTGTLLPTNITGHLESVQNVSFLGDSTTLASVAFNGVITLWDLDTSLTTTQHISGYQDRLAAEAFSSDGSKHANIGFDGKAIYVTGNGFSNSSGMPNDLIRLKDVRTGIELQNFKGARNSDAVVFSPDGKTVAFGGHGNIRLWNTETNESTEIPLDNYIDNRGSSHTAKVTTLVFSPDGNDLVCGTMGGKVHQWNANTGERYIRDPLFDTRVSHEKKTQHVFRSRINRPSDNDNDDAIDGERLEDVGISYPEAISTLAFSPDGGLLAIASTRRIHLLGIKRQISFRELSRSAKVLRFTMDNNLLICGLADGIIEVWDLSTVDIVATLEGHTGSVQSLVFSSDGKTLVSTAKDGTILVWDWDEVLAGSDQ